MNVFVINSTMQDLRANRSTLKARYFLGVFFMGFRYRKSINLGGGARLNFSKKGVGWSIGGKGFRYTKKSDGGTRTTTTLPGTGISYVKESSPKNATKTPKQQRKTNNIFNESPDPNNKKKNKKNWGFYIIAILTLLFIFKFHTISRYIALMLFIYVAYVVVYKYILKRQPPYSLPVDKSKYFQTKWVASGAVILFILTAYAGSLDASSKLASTATTEQNQTKKHTDSKKDSSKSNAKAASSRIAASQSQLSDSISESSVRASSEAAASSTAVSISAANSTKAASESSEQAASIAQSESIASSQEEASVTQAQVAASSSQAAVAQTQTTQTTTTSNSTDTWNGSPSGLRWAI